MPIQDWANAKKILCPSCGGSMMHPVSVRVNRGGEITIVDSDGTRMKAALAEGRGATIEIEFECEDGHASTIRYQFHKGSTYTESVFDGPLPTQGTTGEPIRRDTLWRD